MQLDDALNISARMASRVHSSPAYLERGFPLRKARIGRNVTCADMPLLEPPPHLGFGASVGRGNQGWRVAVRAWTIFDLHHPAVDGLRRIAAGEVDIRLTGAICARTAYRGTIPDPKRLKRRVRPLLAGYSVGHYKVTAGTLGAFVRNSEEELLMLSNNHVLANSNLADRGDSILQPGRADGGESPGDVVGRLSNFHRLRLTRNKVDAAVATIKDIHCPDRIDLPGIGRPSGALWQASSMDFQVQKVGRTTGLTSGIITAIGLRNLPVRYGRSIYHFDDALEVRHLDGALFSEPGDSGSIVLDRDRATVGLLFAGSDEFTYLNPISAVLESLDVELAT